MTGNESLTGAIPPESGNGTEQTNELPGNYAELVAKRAAIEAKLNEIETVTVPAMRERWQREAAEIGKTLEQVVGIAARKPRGRKPKSKQDE